MTGFGRYDKEGRILYNENYDRVMKDTTRYYYTYDPKTGDRIRYKQEDSTTLVVENTVYEDNSNFKHVYRVSTNKKTGNVVESDKYMSKDRSDLKRQVTIRDMFSDYTVVDYSGGSIKRSVAHPIFIRTS